MGFQFLLITFLWIVIVCTTQQLVEITDHHPDKIDDSEILLPTNTYANLSVTNSEVADSYGNTTSDILLR